MKILSIDARLKSIDMLFSISYNAVINKILVPCLYQEDVSHALENTPSKTSQIPNKKN